MARRLFLFMGVASLLAAPFSGKAEARGIRFTGPHPVSPKLLKGMCYIQGPHVHSYRPHKPILYVRVGRAHAFVGDPVEFEAKAPRYSYYGHHPAFWLGPAGRGKHYCYINGPHHHWHAPPPGHRVRFKMKGGVRWYVGGHPKWYRPKHWRVRAFGRHYGRVRFHRPVVHVKPPRGFVGVIVGGPGLHGSVKIKGPGVKIKMKGKSLFGVPIVGGKVKLKGMGHGVKIKVKGGGGRGFKLKGGKRGGFKVRGGMRGGMRGGVKRRGMR